MPDADRDPIPGFPAETADIRGADWQVAARDPGVDYAELSVEGLEGYDDARQRAAALPLGAGPHAVVVAADSVAATLELEEVVHAFRDRPVTIEARPIHYLASLIRLFAERPEFVLPDRGDLTPRTPCLRAYARHLADVAVRRGAAVVGLPEAAADSPLEGNRPVEAADLLQVPRGRITEGGLRENIRMAIEYLAGDPAVARIDAEFACAQLWQWVSHETGVLDTGRIVTPDLFGQLLEEECGKLREAVQGPAFERDRLDAAAKTVAGLALAGSLGALPA